MGRGPIVTIVFLLVLSIIVASVHASETIDVPARADITRTIFPQPDFIVSGTLSTNGDEPIDFVITYPAQGSLASGTIAQYNSTLGTSFSFTAQYKIYVLHFVNRGTVSTQITIDYSITPKFLSIAWFNRNIVAIAIFCVVAVVIVILAYELIIRGKQFPVRRTRHSHKAEDEARACLKAENSLSMHHSSEMK